MTYARRTILGFLDFVASIAFIAALIVALKPWLLQDNPSVISSRSLSSFLEALENIFLRRGFSSDYSDALQQLRNIVVFSLMGGYIILKALVIGFSKNGRLKIISALLVLLTLLSVVLVSDKFLLFVLFLLLLYICFEFSCGFPWKDISTRIRDIFIITIIAYLVVHIVRIGDIRASIMFILTELSLPIKSWL
ncbi:MAG: hypothetical protein IIT58_03705 [Treponema sp.]|nr:hypothetical protein [Treponema sp.]